MDQSTHIAAALAAMTLLAGLAPARAASAIGGAVMVKNDVRGETGGRRARIAKGDEVYRDQLIQTAADSMAKFVFLDLTNMALGPQSRAKLDRFVYNGDGTARSVSVSATRGAFRFFSGNSPSRAYTVTTPQAVIGVRGTTYDVRIAGGRTLVVLQEGAVNVCVRNTARCRELSQPGASVSVTDTDIEGPIAPSSGGWTFGSLCAGARELCAKTTRFALAPKARPPAKSRAAKPAKPPRHAQKPPRRRVIVVEEEPIYVGRPRPPLVEYDVYVPRPGWRPPRWRPSHRGERPPQYRPSREGGRRPPPQGRSPRGPQILLER